MVNIERARERTRRAGFPSLRWLPAMLKGADEYAQAALHLLYLEEMGIWWRLFERLRRRFHPTQDDNEAQALVDRLIRTSARPPPGPSRS